MKTTYSLGKCVELGLDEAGRGCFWGPLYAGAVIWPPEEEWIEGHREISPLINDSKKIPEKKRDGLAEQIKALAIDWGQGKVEASEIDEKGMTWANQEAFRRAMAACSSGVEPDLLLIDGILGLPEREVPFECIPGGDDLYLPIAAASILAKVGRDRWVAEWSSKNSQAAERYDLLNNKGYGTAKHREGLKNHGAHDLHRKLFIRNWCG